MIPQLLCDRIPLLLAAWSAQAVPPFCRPVGRAPNNKRWDEEIEKFSFNSFLPINSIKKSDDKLRMWSEKNNKKIVLKNGFMDIKLYFLTIDLK